MAQCLSNAPYSLIRAEHLQAFRAKSGQMALRPRAQTPDFETVWRPAEKKDESDQLVTAANRFVTRYLRTPLENPRLMQF